MVDLEAELEALKNRVEALEKKASAHEHEQIESTREVRRIQRLRLWENIPLTLFILLLAYLAAHWVFNSVFNWGGGA